MTITKEKQRAEITLASKIYGEMPKKPLHLDYTTDDLDAEFAAGKATLSHNRLVIDLGEKNIEIPITSVIPVRYEKSPAIIFLSYDRQIPAGRRNYRQRIFHIFYLS
ncbi:MAG: hypothetical protein J6V80_01210 [Clostridia bacterium]|nr:hypothetical protein [Clostridia bacterium]